MVDFEEDKNKRRNNNIKYFNKKENIVYAKIHISSTEHGELLSLTNVTSNTPKCRVHLICY